MKKASDTKTKYIVPLLVFAVMLALNFLTPMVSDDFAHYYGMTGEHCTTAGQILRDMTVFRTSTNGRVAPHFFVYLFLAMPKSVFNVVNAAFASGLVVLLGKFYDGKPMIAFTAAAMLWVFIPDFGQVFLWLTGSVNYLWGLVLFTAFVFPFYSSYIKGTDDFNVATLSLLGLVAGAWSENGATAALFACGFFGLLIWINRKQFPVKLFIPYAACALGYVFLMTAPATSGTRVGGDLAEHIWFIRVCLKDYCLVLFIIYFVLLVAAVLSKADRKVIVSTVILVAAGVVSILVFIFAVYLPARSFYILVTFLILSCLMLLNQLKVKEALPVFAVIMAAAFSVRFYSGTKDIINMFRQSEMRYQVLSNAEGITEIEKYHASTKYAAVSEEELSEDENNWYNDLVAKYYGVEGVRAK